MSITLPVQERDKPRHLVVDSTGVKVHGEGEWKVRQHGWSYRRSWLKLHLCVDETTLESLRAVASTNNLSDAEVLPDLLEDIAGTIDQVSADGAYDQRKCYDDLNRHQAKAANRESIQRTVIENCAPEPNDSSRNARHHQD